MTAATSAAAKPTYTIATARPRRMRKRATETPARLRTSGSSSSAISAGGQEDEDRVTNRARPPPTRAAAATGRPTSWIQRGTDDPVRPARHGTDRTAADPARPVSDEPRRRRIPALQRLRTYATVPAMSPRAHGSRNRGRRTTPRAAGHPHRFAGLLAVSIVLVVTLLLTAFGVAPSRTETVAVASARPQVAHRAAAGADRRDDRPAAPAAARSPRRASRRSATTAPARARCALDPLGERGNKGWLAPAARPDLRRRAATRSSGTSSPAAAGRRPSSLDVGAAPGTDVFSPVDGTIVGIARRRDRPAQARRPHRHPARRARRRSIVSISAAARRSGAHRRLGRRGRERREARDACSISPRSSGRRSRGYTQDAGNHVSLVVRPAATFSLP